MQLVFQKFGLEPADVRPARVRRPHRRRPPQRAVIVLPGQLTLPTERRRHRNSRHRDVRARIIPARALTRKAVQPLDPETRAMLDDARPVTRADCQGGIRPCPFVACRHHLYLDVNEETGSIKINFPDIEPDELHPSCSLDIADAGGATLENVGKMMNVTRERARQMYLDAKLNVVEAGLDRVKEEWDEDDQDG